MNMGSSSNGVQACKWAPPRMSETSQCYLNASNTRHHQSMSQSYSMLFNVIFNVIQCYLNASNTRHHQSMSQWSKRCFSQLILFNENLSLA